MSKNEKIVCLFTIGVFAAQFVDIFFVHSEYSILGDSVLARIIGIFFVFIAVKILDFHMGKHCFRPVGIGREVLYGIFFSVVPIVVCFTLETIYFKLKGYENLQLSFDTPNYYYFKEGKYLLLAVAIYFLVMLIGTFFKETYFRGFLITQLSPRFGVFKANLIQAVVYALFSLPYMVFIAISGVLNSQSFASRVMILSSYIVVNFICGLKYGYFFRVNGSLWMGITDHFINNIILMCVYISPDRLPDKWYIAEVILIQVASCIMFIPFYIYRDKRNVMIAQSIEAGICILASGGDLYTPEEEKKLFRIDNYSAEEKPKENVDEYFDTIKNKYLVTDIVDLRPEEALEELVDADKIEEKPSVDNFVKSIPTFDLPDIPETDEKETVSIDEGIQELKKENEPLKQIEEIQDNSDGIASAVNQYFDEQFNKRTFTDE